jgi:co-chaperonin GroES (HSP10)|tara:strand:- start:6088 stop:6381 length:294 start_codon:yes stop_codon:yes gene_type:complete
MTFEPFGANVFVERDDEEAQEDTWDLGGEVKLFKPEAYQAKNTRCVARVLAVGPAVSSAQVGDMVVYRKYAEGVNPRLSDTETQFILQEEEILGRLT